MKTGHSLRIVAASFSAIILNTHFSLAQMNSSVPFPRDQVALQLGALQMSYVAPGTAFDPASDAQKAANALVQGRIAISRSSGWGTNNVAGATPPANPAAYASQLDSAVMAVMASAATNTIKGKVTMANGKIQAITAKLALPSPSWSVPLPYAIDALTASSIGGAGGGTNNTADGTYSWVGGGIGNTASANFATVTAGATNTASGQFSTVAGGGKNTASDYYATVGGGRDNTASGQFSTVAGGSGNTASGDRATVAGGGGNTASGAYTFAAGLFANAVADGQFVWADNQPKPYSGNWANRTNTFSVRAQGGVTFSDGGNPEIEMYWKPAKDTWTYTSDAGTKENFRSIDAREVLRNLAALPVTEWNYKGYKLRNIGPMAQDWHRAFPSLGENDKTINSGDVQGISLIAIKGLIAELAERDRKIEQLTSKLEAINERLESLPRAP